MFAAIEVINAIPPRVTENKVSLLLNDELYKTIIQSSIDNSPLIRKILSVNKNS